jgi:peptidoglycan/LPS O-acetylase OafA/YrhL
VVATLSLFPEITPVPLDQWWVHLLGLQIYQGQGAIEGLTQTWSLCTEIAFYALLPVLGLLSVVRVGGDATRAWRRAMMVLTAMVVIAVLFLGMRATTTLLPYQAGWWLPAYLDWFAGGMLLAVVEVRRRLPSPPRLVRVIDDAARDTWSCLVIAVALFSITVTPVGGAYDFTPTAPFQTLLKHWLYLGAAFFLLLPGVLHGGRAWTSLLARPVPRRLGLVSYGIFLWHLVLLRTLMPALGIPFFAGRTAEVLTVLVVATIAVATVTYRLVERPAQRWAHRR